MLLPFYAGTALEHFSELAVWVRRNETMLSSTKTMCGAGDKAVQKMLEWGLEGIQSASPSRELDEQHY